MFGEVFICQFPFTSGTGSKIRPALVLFDLQQDAVICRVTSVSRTGTLDGDGRRSIYTAVRRNFLQPMMLAFDTPIPFNTMGRLNVSNVPAQALILMNDPFIVEQAKLWSQRTTTITDAVQRVRQMYLTAFSRLPTPEEITDANTFLAEQRALHVAKDPKGDARAWADFAHVLFNVKEFIYLN